MIRSAPNNHSITRISDRLYDVVLYMPLPVDYAILGVLSPLLPTFTSFIFFTAFYTCLPPFYIKQQVYNRQLNLLSPPAGRQVLFCGFAWVYHHLNQTIKTMQSLVVSRYFTRFYNRLRSATSSGLGAFLYSVIKRQRVFFSFQLGPVRTLEIGQGQLPYC